MHSTRPRRRSSCDLAFFLLLVVGCGSRTALIAPEIDDDEDASVVIDGSVRKRDASTKDAIDDPIDEPVFDPMCVADAGPPSTSACHATLHVMAIQKSMPSCFVDVVAMEGDTASLDYDCMPSGNARVVVNGKTFVGTYDEKTKTLDVCTGTTFPWSDGCQWRSAQHFRGDPKSGFLTFTYSEMPYQGMGCQPPCQAFAQVKIGP